MLQGVKQSGAFSGLHCMSANVFSLSQCRGTINTVSAHLFFAFFSNFKIADNFWQQCNANTLFAQRYLSFVI